MSTRRNRATKRTDYSRTPPSSEWVAERDERLAGYVETGGLEPDDVSEASRREKLTHLRLSDHLTEMGLTVLEFGGGRLVVRCPHCNRRRKATNQTGYDWLRAEAVPKCNLNGYVTCKPEVKG